MGTVTRLHSSNEMTVAEAVDAFQVHYLAGLAPKTRSAYGATLAAFVAEFGEADVYRLDPDAVARVVPLEVGRAVASDVEREPGRAEVGGGLVE